ncbi:MAG: ABC transporter substrate-binding protein [Thermomicrobiales bacterium]
MVDESARRLMEEMRRGRLSRREFVRRAALLGFSGSAIAAFLIACGSSSPTATTATSSSSSTSSAAAAASSSATTTSKAASTTSAAATTSSAAATGSASSTTTKAATPTSGGTPAGGGATGPAKSVKLGAVLSLTADAQVYGTVQQNAVKMAVDEVNSGNVIPGVQLSLIVEDDASKKDQGITAFDKLIKTDQVIAIIGPTLSNTAVATDPSAQQAGVPVLGVSTTADGITTIGDYIFRDSLAEAQVIPVTIKTAKEKLTLKKVGIIYGNDDAFTKSGFDVFKKALDDNGIQYSTPQTYAKGDTDFSAQLTEIKGGNPDAIVVSALANEGTLIVKQARDLGFKGALIGGNGLNSPAIIKGAGAAAEGVIVGAAWNSANDTPENQKFIAAYKAKYNADPDQFAAQAYSGVYIMADALKRAGANADRKALRDALAQTKDLTTPLGKFSFTPQRDADHPPVIQVVKNGKFDVLK